MSSKSPLLETVELRQPSQKLIASKNHILFLDGIRAIAVLLVITAHTPNDQWAWLGGPLGVSLFFVLSGYLITSIALAEEKKKGRFSFKGFYLRRMFRIFPLYYLVLAIYCVSIFKLNLAPERKPLLLHLLPYYLTYFQDVPYLLWHSPMPFVQSWSLGIEEKFYLVWPVISFALLGKLKPWRIPSVLILIIACMAFGPLTESYASIFLGCLLALCLRFDSVRHGFGRSTQWGVYGMVLVIVGTHVAIAYHKLWHGSTVYAAIFAVLLGMMLTSNNRINQLLSLRPLVLIGRFSYGMYLVHLLCRRVAEHIGGGSTAVIYFWTCAISFVAAACLYYVIERPLIQVGRKLAANYC